MGRRGAVGTATEGTFCSYLSSTLFWQDLFWLHRFCRWKLARAAQMPGVHVGKWKGWGGEQTIRAASRLSQAENLVRTREWWLTALRSLLPHPLSLHNDSGLYLRTWSSFGDKLLLSKNLGRYSELGQCLMKEMGMELVCRFCDAWCSGS